MEDLFNRVEMAVSRYEQACQQEEILYDMMQDADRDYARYSSQMSSSENPDARSAVAEQMAAAQQRYIQYQSQLQQAQSIKLQALRELQATRSGITDAMQSLTQKLQQITQSISAFEQMASLPFGGASAAEKLSFFQNRHQEYQQNLNDLGTLADRIDSVLNGDGNSPKLVLHRRR